MSEKMRGRRDRRADGQAGTASRRPQRGGVRGRLCFASAASACGTREGCELDLLRGCVGATDSGTVVADHVLQVIGNTLSRGLPRHLRECLASALHEQSPVLELPLVVRLEETRLGLAHHVHLVDLLARHRLGLEGRGHGAEEATWERWVTHQRPVSTSRIDGLPGTSDSKAEARVLVQTSCARISCRSKSAHRRCSSATSPCREQERTFVTASGRGLRRQASSSRLRRAAGDPPFPP